MDRTTIRLKPTEWLDALESLIEQEGVDEPKYILSALLERASRDGTSCRMHHQHRSVTPSACTKKHVCRVTCFMETPYFVSLIRWNAMAMVVRVRQPRGDLGGQYFHLFVLRPTLLGCRL